MDFDIAVIGGGLNGLSAAKAAMKAGAKSLVLIEGKNIGFNNPSPLTFCDLIDEFDLTDCIQQAYDCFFFDNYKGSSIRYNFGRPTLALLKYKDACYKIFGQLSNFDTQFEFINQFVSEVEPGSDRVTLTLKDGTRLTARVLIDASGKAQITARALGVARETSYYSHVYGAYYTGVDGPPGDICGYMMPSQELASGGGWYYSVGANEASFGYALINQSPETDFKHLRGVFEQAQSTFEPYSGYLKPAKIEHIEKGVIPLSYVTQFVHNNIIMSGDAGGIATNWTCMGTEPALRYGDLAGQLAAEAIRENDMSRLNQYQQSWEASNKAVYDLTMAHAHFFWDSDHYFWEWNIKNDLAFLTPEQVVDRLRANAHLNGKYRIFWRALKFKIKTLISKKYLDPKDIVISA